MKMFICQLLLITAFQTAICQSFSVEKVRIKETISNKTYSNIPKVKSNLAANKTIVQKINAEILELFMVKSFDPTKITEFRWFNVDFKHEIQNDILYISYSGEYLGAYPSYSESELFFNLKTGELLQNFDIPFQALFSLQGYFNFLNNHWLPKAKKAFTQAVEDCDGNEPYCSFYDIESYSVSNNAVIISLANDCYPHVMNACSPEVTVAVPKDSLVPYLSDFGNSLLFEKNYTSTKGIATYLLNKKEKEQLPNNLFLFGKMNDKYPFSMAITIKEGGEVEGYYYYDNRQITIDLKGTFTNNQLQLNEYVDEKLTGSFSISFHTKFTDDCFFIYKNDGSSMYLNGIWTNHNQTKSYKINFTEVKFTKE